MTAFADTFGGKLCLLAIDKLVIGAIVAAALYFYDQHKTEDSRQYQAQLDKYQEAREERQSSIQLQFEQARLIREVLPVIQDRNVDRVTRGYLLRSAVLTQSLDAVAAFEIGTDLLRDGLSAHHYKSIMKETLPESIGALAARGVEISREWHETLGYFPNFDIKFNPASGREHLPSENANLITEARLLREFLYTNIHSFQGCQCPELSDETEIPIHLFGLFTLLHTRDLERADKLSISSETSLRLLGMVFRQWLRRDDDLDASEYLRGEFMSAGTSDPLYQRAMVLLAILRWISDKHQGFGSPAFATLLAEIAVGNLNAAGTESREEGDIYWLRWKAAEALLLSGDGAAQGIPIVLKYLNSFGQDLMAANDSSQLRALSTKYDSGKIILVLVSVVGQAGTAEDRKAIRSLLDIEEEKLRNFPFLTDELRSVPLE